MGAVAARRVRMVEREYMSATGFVGIGRYR